MTIRIVPIEQLSTQAAQVIAPLLLPDPATLYAARAARFRRLAEGHSMADYLQLAARVAEAQAELVREQPVKLEGVDQLLTQCARHGMPPLSLDGWRREPVWHAQLDGLIGKLRSAPLSAPVEASLDRLATAGPHQREWLANALLAGDIATVGADAAPFLWAALGVYWSGLAAALPAQAIAEPGETRALCPVCAAPPVASVIRLGAETGLRYLHCALCESEWHVVRAKCTSCDSSRDLAYWSLDSHDAAVRAESCGDCGNYLKLMDQTRELEVEPVADDLATLALDLLTEEQGFARSGLNPFLFVQ
jgi:FdhE protein